MQSRSEWKMARAAVLTAALALLSAAMTPVLAADPGYEGWFLALDAAMTQPTGLDQHYATTLDIATGAQEILILDNDSGLSWGAKIGYSWGDLGGLALSYWTFDNDETLDGTEDTRYVYPTVFGGYAYNYGGSYGLFPATGYPVIFTVGSDVKADTFDLEYFRAMEAGERMSIKWIAGLRSATYEEDLGFSGQDAFGTSMVQTKHIESDGIGVKVGAVFDFGFSENFSLQGRLAFSFLQGNVDAVTTQDVNGTPDRITVTNDNVRGEIRDYDLRAVWKWKAFDLYLGYGGQTWDGLVKDPTGDMVNFPATKSTGDDRESVAFNSVHAGVVFRFGGT